MKFFYRNYLKSLNICLIIFCCIINPIYALSGNYFYENDPIEGINIKITKPDFTLRTFHPERDQDFLKFLYQDPELMKTFLITGKALTDENFSNLFKYWQQTKAKSPFTIYIMEDTKHKTPLGIFEFIKKDKTLEISYIISPAFQNQGWGTRLIKAVIDDFIPFLRQKSALEDVICLIGYILETNNSSLKILKKAGFIPQLNRNGYDIPDNWKLFNFPLQ